jgi:F-type H+-transporting ATPase subunit delta
MKSSQVGARYASALYQLASDAKKQDEVFEQMRSLGEALKGDAVITEFLNSPVVRPSQKEAAFAAVFKAVKVNDIVRDFVSLLARKQRLDAFKDIVVSYQEIADAKNGVVRGLVRSTTVLAPEERKRIEETVNKVTGKQSLLSYKEDPSLLGGMVAEVGSYTFDDSLSSHLRRMNEELTNNGQI